MKIEEEYISKEYGFVKLIENNKTVKATGVLLGFAGLGEMGLNSDQTSEDLTRVFAITVLAFLTAVVFETLENAEKTK